MIWPNLMALVRFAAVHLACASLYLPPDLALCGAMLALGFIVISFQKPDAFGFSGF